MDSAKFFSLLLFIGLYCSLQAQDDRFSYISDRKFFSPADLIGYTFLPSEKEYTDGDKEEISPGGVIFAVTNQGLRITGGEYEGIYNAVSIDASKYGYIMKLMDARNPADQGHVKFILDSRANVDALVFKKNKNRPEVIFYQEQLNDRAKKADAKYFTDRGELRVAEADSIWGSKIYPFLRISQQIQDRIVPEDSVYIEFVKEQIVKAVKEKEVAVVEAPKEEEIEENTLEGDEDFIMTDNDDDEPEEVDDEEDEDWIDEDDPLAGMLKKQKAKTKKPEKEKKPKKEKKEGSDDSDEEEFLDVDDVDEDELIDETELARIEEEEAEKQLQAAEKQNKKQKKVKAPKAKYKYYIVLRFNRWEGSGEEAVRKEERIVYPVKTWNKKTSPDAKDVNVRHLMEYATKPNGILVFTDENNNVSKIIIGSVEYLMRGY